MNALTGVRADAVVSALEARRASGVARPAGNERIALVIEGGGMRGVLSAGSLLALDLLGFRHAFDEVYATSAGAVNAAYFLSGQGRLGITVYFDSLTTRRFINPLRVGKIVDVGYAYDHVVTRVKPLDEAAIRKGPTALCVTLTNARTGVSELVDLRGAADAIPTMLKAASALPVLYNRTVRLAGVPYVDGGLTDSIPIEQAIARGCTHILVLLTRPPGHVERPPNVLLRGLFAACMGWKYPRLQGAYRTDHLRAAASRSLAFGAGVPDGVSVATISPSIEDMVVKRTTVKRGPLVEGARRLAARTFRIFAGDETILDRAFRDFESPPGSGGRRRTR